MKKCARTMHWRNHSQFPWWLTMEKLFRPSCGAVKAGNSRQTCTRRWNFSPERPCSPMEIFHESFNDVVEIEILKFCEQNTKSKGLIQVNLVRTKTKNRIFQWNQEQMEAERLLHQSPQLISIDGHFHLSRREHKENYVLRTLRRICYSVLFANFPFH